MKRPYVKRNGLLKSATAVALLLCLGRLWGGLPVSALDTSPNAAWEVACEVACEAACEVACEVACEAAPAIPFAARAPRETQDPARLATELLREGLEACAGEVDLSACCLPVARLGEVYAALLYDAPELFYVALRLSYTARTVPVAGEAVRVVATVYPSYVMEGEELAAARDFYDRTVTAILGEMEEALGVSLGGGAAGTAAGTPSEAEMVLFLHDLLADRYAYDTRATGANVDAYSFFLEGMGVCQAYALAFMALAREAGLAVDFVSSEAMDHAWNHVQVDGVWYHVDVTRDDPLGAEVVNHTRLLRSDEGMTALGYHDYGCPAGHRCEDRRYETGTPSNAPSQAPSDSPNPALSADSLAVLVGRVTPLPFGGWVASDGEGAPRRLELSSDGAAVRSPGDLDGDGALTPADLLLAPPHLRPWLRACLVENEENARGVAP